MVCTVGGDPGAAKIARDRTRTEQQIAKAIIFNEKMMVSLRKRKPSNIRERKPSNIRERKPSIIPH